MLPQIGLSEMLLLGMLALVVLGPRDLSLMMRRMGRWTGKLRALAWEFRQSFEEIGRQAELEELKKEVEALKKATTDDLSEIRKDIEKTDAEIARDAGAAEMKARDQAEARAESDALAEAERDISAEQSKITDKTEADKAQAGGADQAEKERKLVEDTLAAATRKPAGKDAAE